VQYCCLLLRHVFNSSWIRKLTRKKSNEAANCVTSYLSEDLSQKLTKYGKWIVIINATCDPMWTRSFCEELASLDNGRNSSHYSGKTKRRTIRKILLVGGKNLNGANRLEDLAKKVSQQLEQQQGNFTYKVEYLRYPSSSESPSSEPFSFHTPSSTAFRAKLDAKLGQLLLDGGVALFVLCPPSDTMCSQKVLCDEFRCKHVLRYIHDTTVLLKQTMVPTLMFRNSGAIVQLGLPLLPTASSSIDHDKMNVCVYNAAQGYLTQLMRNMHYEYASYGIDCLSLTISSPLHWSSHENGDISKHTSYALKTALELLGCHPEGHCLQDDDDQAPEWCIGLQRLFFRCCGIDAEPDKIRKD